MTNFPAIVKFDEKHEDVIYWLEDANDLKSAFLQQVKDHLNCGMFYDEQLLVAQSIVAQEDGLWALRWWETDLSDEEYMWFEITDLEKPKVRSKT